MQWRRMLMLAALAAVAAAPAPVARFTAFRMQGASRAPLRPSEYRNPVLPGFRPDPSLVRVGDDFYLAVSSFAWFPGYPIFHSRDLVSWTQIGAGVSRPRQMRLDGLDTSMGLYAPGLAHVGGRFHLLGTCLGCGGNFVLTARTPAGPWSDPVWLPFEGIDPSLFTDDDGRSYVVNNGPPPGPPRYDGHRALWLQRINLRTLRMTGPRTPLVNGGVDIASRPSWIEGPHIFRRDGWYYLIAAEGGTGDRHSQVVFRARSVRGPYMPGPANPILTQRDLDPARPDPVSSVGHADFVRTPAGDWWAVFLGARPYAGELYNTGRETFLLPVRWVAGWPRILDPGVPVPLAASRPRLRAAPPASPDIADDFTRPALGPPWTWLGAPRQRWWRTGAGGLRLTPRAAPLGGSGQPAFVAVRQSQPDATASVRVAFAPRRAGDRAGLAVFQDQRHFFLLSVAARADGREVRLERRRSADEPGAGTPAAAAPLPAAGPVDLRVDARGPRYAFAYRPPGAPWRTLAVEDGTILSTRRAGGFTGVMIGPAAVRAP